MPAGFVFYGFGMVLTQAFNGAGDTRTPTIIICLPLAVGDPAGVALAHPAGFGPTGVFIAVSVAFATLAAVSVWLFRKGEWKTGKV